MAGWAPGSTASAGILWATIALLILGGCYGMPDISGRHGSDAAATIDSGMPSTDSAATPRENGVLCSASSDCRSGICADGVCCAEDCSGACRACNLPAAPGRCSPVIAQEEDGCQGLQSCDSTGGCTDRFTEFPTPTSASGPLKIAIGTDGNLWFTESAANKIGRISPSGAIAEYSIPTTASFPVGIALGPDGVILVRRSVGQQDRPSRGAGYLQRI